MHSDECNCRGNQLGSFPGPAQLSVVSSTENWGKPSIFSHVSMM